MKFIVDQQVEDIEFPENLKLNMFLKEFHSDCHHRECNFGYYGFAFGQSPFPVPNIMQEALKKNSDKGNYAPVPGIEELRETISIMAETQVDKELTEKEINEIIVFLKTLTADIPEELKRIEG